jgi:hypothetical protein
MDLFTSPLEDEEMSLRDLAMPSMEDIEMQKSDLTLATTHYEVKPGIIKLVETNPFRGLEDVLTQNVHLAPNTQQAEQAGFTRAESHETCQSIFPEN